MVSILSGTTLQDSVFSWYVIWCLVCFYYHRVKFLVVLFSKKHTCSLENTAQRYDIKYHSNTDDTQLYTSQDPDNDLNFPSLLTNYEYCIVDIRLWMTLTLLRLNDNTTNITYFESSNCVTSLKPTALLMMHLRLPVIGQ